MSTNLSQQKRDSLIETLEFLKERNTDIEIKAKLTEIEKELKSKKYGLIWEEHEEKVDEELKKNIPVFREKEEKEICSDKNNNINFLLEGDNLHSLYLLEKTHKNKIDFIYIDPPYNTENKEFIYDDKRIGIDDGYRHSKWISFMAKRLNVARKLLSNDGVIFISIDKNEFAQLKLLCDDIFGENNFIGTLIWRKKYGGGQTDEFFVTEHEYIFGYRKTDKFNWIDKKVQKTDESYKYEDKNGKFNITKLEKWGSSAHREDRPTMYFSILDPDKNELFPIAPDGQEGRWRVGKNRMEDLIKNDLIYWNKDKKNNRWIPYEKTYYTGNEYKIIKSRSILYDLAETGDATKTLTEIFEKKDVFPNPKPVEIIRFLLEHTKSKTVLDFFAGSGTTAQAVLEQNKEDGKNRKFILCTNNENNICEEITYKRIEKVIKGYGNHIGIPANLKYYTTEYVKRYHLQNEDIELSDELLNNIKELVVLENNIRINNKIKLILKEDDLSDIKNWSLPDISKVYISSDILLDSEVENSFIENNIKIIYVPEYYYRSEIEEL